MLWYALIIYDHSYNLDNIHWDNLVFTDIHSDMCYTIQS
jgi:hypothetical protein